jgi:hypothetical protein
MPEPVEPPPPTAKQKREWRAEFKRLGRELTIIGIALTLKGY